MGAKVGSYWDHRRPCWAVLGCRETVLSHLGVVLSRLRAVLGSPGRHPGLPGGPLFSTRCKPRAMRNAGGDLERASWNWRGTARTCQECRTCKIGCPYVDVRTANISSLSSQASSPSSQVEAEPLVSFNKQGALEGALVVLHLGELDRATDVRVQTKIHHAKESRIRLWCTHYFTHKQFGTLRRQNQRNLLSWKDDRCLTTTTQSI